LNPLSNKNSGSDVELWDEIWGNGNARERLDELIELTKYADASNFDHFFETMYTNHTNFPDVSGAIMTMSTYLDRCQNAANHSLHLDAFLRHVFLVDSQ